MDSRDLLQKAERALRTGQPNLATLYMKRARQRIAQEVARQRRQRAKLSFLQALLVARLDAIDVAKPFIEFLDAFREPTQNDFALVGDGPAVDTSRGTNIWP